MSATILTPDRRIRVFISSRIGEFAVERQALVVMIRKMGLTPIIFEETARNHRPRDLYSALVQQSDIFLGLYGTGYGWIDEPNGMTISGLHDEWILSEEMPRIVFIKDTPDPRESRLDELLAEIEGAGPSFNRFRTRAELIKRARDAIALCVTERFLAAEESPNELPPDYATQLAVDLENLPVLQTGFFATEVLPTVAGHRRVFIEGSFGSGKTVILYLLGREQKSIYLSLRHQSLLGALSHFCDHLAVILGECRRRLLSAEEAHTVCESLLRRSTVTLLVDDIDQAPDVAAGLASLSTGSSRLIFAGRFVPKSFANDFCILRCPGFTTSEAEKYVSLALPTAPITAQVAVEQSGGNPLYLRYYLQSAGEDKPPPRSVEEYHASMWTDLNVRQKELIAVLCLSEVTLIFSELAKVLGAYRRTEVTGIAAKDETLEIPHLLSVGKNSAQIFHPAFREFVQRELQQADLAREIHRHLAVAFTNKADRTFYVVHLARAGLAKKVYRELLSAAHWAEVTGRSTLARELIASVLRVARKKRHWDVLGLGLHQSANLKQHTRDITSALFSARLSEKMFLRSNRPGVSLIARSAKAIFLVEMDRAEEAEIALREVAEAYHVAGITDSEALVRVNLAFVLVRRGRMKECAEQCLIAIPLFKKVGNSYGVATALLNLQNYYIATTDRKKQIECIKKLKSLSRELDSPRLELAVYNGLTILYRREDKYEKAEKVCLKAIVLARKLGIWDAEISNTGNLGNVYRDQKRYDKARECYETTMRIAAEKNSPRHIAWGKELLATIIEREGDVAASVRLGEEALILLQNIGDVHREATTAQDQARRFHKLANYEAAARSSETAAHAWGLCGVFHEAAPEYARAIRSWIKANADGEAARTFDAAWKHLPSEDQDESLRLLSAISSHVVCLAPLIDLPAIVGALPWVLQQSCLRSVARDAIGAVAHICQARFQDSRTYERLLRSLAERFAAERSENTALALAFAIEQSPDEVFDGDTFRQICTALNDGDAGIKYRCDRLVGERWLIFFPTANNPALEIVADYDYAGIRAAAAMAALMLWARRQWLVERVAEWGWHRLGLSFFAAAAEEFEARGMEMPSHISEEVPSVLAKLSDPSDSDPTPIPLIIRRDFLQCANKVAHPDNRVSLALIMQLCEGIVDNFSHGKVPSDRIRAIRFDLACDVFGMRQIESEIQQDSHADDDIDDLI